MTDAAAVALARRAGRGALPTYSFDRFEVMAAFDTAPKGRQPR